MTNKLMVHDSIRQSKKAPVFIPTLSDKVSAYLGPMSPVRYPISRQ